MKKKNNYQKPLISVITINAESPFMQGSGGSTTPNFDLENAVNDTPPEADSKQNSVWDSKW